MKVKFSVVLLLSVFACVGLQTTAFAQCAVCEIVEGCYECGQGPEGGTSCFTSGCLRCRTTGSCGLVLRAKTNLPKAPLSVSEDISRAIATRNLRLAAILSDLGRETVLRESYTFHLANVQLNAEDIEWWLNANDQSPIFAGVREEAKRLNRNKPELLYDVSLQASPDSAFATLVIQQRNGSASDSAGTPLRLTLIKDTAKWTVLSWEIK